MKKHLFGGILCASVLAVSAISLSIFNKDNKAKPLSAGDYNQTVPEYYAGINWDLTGSTLKTALHNKIKISTAGWSYDGLWDAYRLGDVRPDGLHFWDIYSDTTDYTLYDSRINRNYSKEGDSINREHVIPQSSFNEKAPMVSDFFHVLPSDGYVNNRRSSYPHDDVVSGITYTSNDGCKLGKNASGTTTFEPMPQYKGDIARIYFYFVTCYQDKLSSNTFSAFDKSTYPSIKDPYLATYLKWAKEDPVSQKEIDRNNVGYSGQGNRNPFVDSPYAIGAIWDPDHASDYGNKGEYTSGSGISISATTASMISGGHFTLTATSTGGTTINWSTSDSGIVSLASSSTASGAEQTLTAGVAGTAVITASTVISGETYTKTCTVTVSATKQVVSIAVTGQTTSFLIDETFYFDGTVTATYNDSSNAVVTDDATFSGYNTAVAGMQTVTVSYSYGGVTATTTYKINVTSSGGSEDISDYTVSTSPLTSDNIVDGIKVAWGTSPTTLARGISDNWVYLTNTASDWLVFTLEGDSTGFTLKNGDNYVASSGKGKVAFGTQYNKATFTLSNNNVVYKSGSGYFVFNSTGLRPYDSESQFTKAYLYLLIPNKTLTGISVDTYPAKMDYEVGETFDPTGLIITRTYSDYSTDRYTYANHTSEFTFNPTLDTPLTLDDDTIEIIYGNHSCFFEIDIAYPDPLDYITISGYRTSFVEGDTFEYGGVVIAYYESGDFEDVTSDATFSGHDTTAVGQQTVTVSYLGETAEYQITVTTGTLASISVSGQTLTYLKNYAFAFDGVCTATFENGYQKNVTPTTVSSPDMSTAGSKTIEVTYTYNGVTKSISYQITVISSRTVIETVTDEIDATITYPLSSNANISGDLEGVSASSSGKTNYESTDKALRLGTGSGGGTITITSTQTISKVDVTARYYTTYSSSTLKVNGRAINPLTNSYETYSITFASPVNTITILTESQANRVNVKSITVYHVTSTTTDISSSEDCVGLEAFIENNMHMDYADNLGYCKDNEHHYYSTAKAAFNALNDHQRQLFTSNEAYAAEWARLQAWAYFNGDTLNQANNMLEIDLNFKGDTFDYTNNDNVVVIISIASIASISMLGILLILKKRKKR